MSIATRRFATHAALFDTPAETVAWYGAMQAQDYPSSLWAVGLHTREATDSMIEDAVSNGSIVRMWPMRGTLHYVAAEDVRWVHALLTPRITAASHRRLAAVGIEPAHVVKSLKAIEKGLAGGKAVTRAELYAILDRARVPTSSQRGYHMSWQCAHEGMICLGPRRGKQPTFVLVDEWVAKGKQLTREESLAEIALRYFRSHAPATLKDFVWWTGLTVADARRAIALADPALEAETIGEETYFSSQYATTSLPSPRARLLPAFDEYLVAYRDRTTIVDPARVRDLNRGGGWLVASVVVDGVVQGTWSRSLTPTGVEVELQLFRKQSRERMKAIKAAAADYATFLGHVLRSTVAQLSSAVQ